MFEPMNLFLSFVFGTAGFAYYRYGKSQGQIVPRVIGVFLMIYPWFVTKTMWILIVGILLSIIPYFIRG